MSERELTYADMDTFLPTFYSVMVIAHRMDLTRPVGRSWLPI